MSLDPIIQEAAERLKSMPPEDRERGLQQLKMLVAAGAPAEALVEQPPIRTLGDYLAAELPIPPSLIDPPLVVRGELTVTVGKSGKGKTTMNLHRMLRWSAGLPMFDELPNVLVPTERAPLRVLVIENEGAATMFQAKMETMVGADDYLPPEYRPLVGENLLIWGDGGYSNFKIDKDKDFDLLRRGVDLFKPDILYVEPMRGVWSGDENSNTEVANMLGRFQVIASESGIAVVIAHHERKGGVGDGGDMMDLARGGSALDGAVAAMENFRQVKGGDYRELSYSKARYGGDPGPIRMEYDPITYWYRYVKDSDQEREILEVLAAAQGEPLDTTEVCLQVNEDGCSAAPKGKGYTAVNKVLNKLKREGRVQSRPGVRGGRLGWALVTDDDEGGLSF